MNVSTDSQVEFEIELDTSEDDMADPGHSEPSYSTVNVAAGVANIDNPVPSTATQDEQPQLAAINTVASSAESGPTNATAASTANTEATPARAASTAFVGCPIGIAPGDGDLMPPRFTDDRHTAADDWLQDFLDYINILHVPKTTASILLRKRLTGAARKWFEALPGGIDFDETIRRFRNRFSASAGRRDELLDGFLNRRQGPNEPTSVYTETMVSMTRRLHLDNEPLLRHAIVQGLRPEIRREARDVRVLRPSTLEDLAEAAAIGESNARLAATGPQQPTDTAVSAQLAEIRSMVAVLTAIVRSSESISARSVAELIPDQAGAVYWMRETDDYRSEYVMQQRSVVSVSCERSTRIAYSKLLHDDSSIVTWSAAVSLSFTITPRTRSRRLVTRSMSGRGGPRRCPLLGLPTRPRI